MSTDNVSQHCILNIWVQVSIRSDRSFLRPSASNIRGQARPHSLREGGGRVPVAEQRARADHDPLRHREHAGSGQRPRDASPLPQRAFGGRLDLLPSSGRKKARASRLGLSCVSAMSSALGYRASSKNVSYSMAASSAVLSFSRAAACSSFSGDSMCFCTIPRAFCASLA